MFKLEKRIKKRKDETYILDFLHDVRRSMFWQGFIVKRDGIRVVFLLCICVSDSSQSPAITRANKFRCKISSKVQLCGNLVNVKRFSHDWFFLNSSHNGSAYLAISLKSLRFSRPISTAFWHSSMHLSYSFCSKYTAARIEWKLHPTFLISTSANVGSDWQSKSQLCKQSMKQYLLGLFWMWCCRHLIRLLSRNDSTLSQSPFSCKLHFLVPSPQ